MLRWRKNMRKHKNYVISVGVMSILVLSTLTVITPYEAEASVFIGLTGCHATPNPAWANSVVTLWATVSNSGSEGTGGVKVVMDYDQDYLTILDPVATWYVGPVRGVDNGDTITWDNVYLPSPPSGGDPLHDIATQFMAQVKVLVSGCAPNGAVLENKVSVELPGHTCYPKTIKINVINPQICGFSFDHQLKNGGSRWIDADWTDEVTATSGNSISLKISLINNGGQTAYIDPIKDYLPNGLEYISNSAYFQKSSSDGNYYSYVEPAIKTIGDDKYLQWKLSNAYNTKKFSIIHPGEKVIITFKATVLKNGEWESKVVLYASAIGFSKSVFPMSDSAIVHAAEYKPILAFTPETYDFGTLPQGEIRLTTIDIWNGGTGLLEYNLSKDCDWVTLSSSSGDSLGEHDSIVAVINTYELENGSENTCNISITSNGGSGTIWITVTIDGDEYIPAPDEGDDNNNGGADDADNTGASSEPPTVTITQPFENNIYRKGIAIANNGITTLIIGGITIKADASDPDNDLSYVEFYVDGELKFTDHDAPFEYEWNKQAFLRHTIKVKAIDQAGNSAEDTVNVFIINFGFSS